MLDSGGASRLEARREEKSEPKCFKNIFTNTCDTSAFKTSASS